MRRPQRRQADRLPSTAGPALELPATRRYGQSRSDTAPEAGEDPLDVAEVGIRDLRDVLGDAAAEEFIDEASYEYFVRR